jgi:hypothetical protein
MSENELGYAAGGGLTGAALMWLLMRRKAQPQHATLEVTPDHIYGSGNVVLNMSNFTPDEPLYLYRVNTMGGQEVVSLGVYGPNASVEVNLWYPNGLWPVVVMDETLVAAVGFVFSTEVDGGD